MHHVWRSNATVYYEHRSADRDKYTYDEIGTHLIGRKRLSEDIDLVARTTGFIRNYENGERDDRRLRGTVGIEFMLGEDTTVETYGGFQRNWSTLPEKDYGGAVFGLQLTKTF